MVDGRHLWPASMSDGMTEASDGMWVYPTAAHTLYDLLRASVERDAHAPALTLDDVTLSYAQLLFQVDDFARTLEECGIHAGSRVGVLLDNSIEFVVAYYAINSLRATTCPLPGKLADEALARLVSRAGIDVLILEENRCEALKECMPCHPGGFPPVIACVRGEVQQWRLPTKRTRAHDVSQHAPAILMFTSGTTSESKGVRISNRAVLHAVEAYRRTLGITSQDSCLIAVPLYHITGMVAVIGLMLSVGGHLYIHRRMDAKHFLADIEQHRISFVHASPTVFALLLPERESFPELPSVRMLACGAAHMPVHMIDELHEWMPHMEFRTIYGLTETTSPGSVMPVDAATSPHKGASGWAIPGLDIRVCDESGQDLPPGERGEIWLRGTNITDGYEGITGALTADRWLHTGDIGWMSEDGYLYVVDRMKDMVNRGGEKVWCVDVEETLRQHEFVEDAAVVGLPDDVYGEVPVAMIVIPEQVRATVGEAEAIRRIVKEIAHHLSKHEMPVHLAAVGSIPLTPGMKVNKAFIRERLAQMYSM